MALIKCPECGKDVSDKAKACIHCGYPLTELTPEEVASTSPGSETTPDTATTAPRKHSKKLLWGIWTSVLALLCLAGCVSYFVLLPYVNATNAFNEVLLVLEDKNAELETAIIEAEALVQQPCLDKALPLVMDTAINEAKSAKYIAPEMPSSVDEILELTKEMGKVDYNPVINTLKERLEDYKISVQRYALVDCPAEEYIIECLKKIPGFVDYAAATEDNDPNGNLHKPGGYTSHVYFESKLVYLPWHDGESLIEKGTDAGGSIEVYTTVVDAEKRNEYLARFDGTATASGSHAVVGTCVVRTSCELNATQQRNYEADIIATLTALPGEKIAFITEEPAVEPGCLAAVTAAETLANSGLTVYPNLVIESLVSDLGFTEEQAAYAILNANIDWNHYATIHLEEYVQMHGKVSQNDVVEHLSVEKGYSDSAIQYALENANVVAVDNNQTQGGNSDTSSTPSQPSKPTNRNQEAIAAAKKWANAFYPTSRYFIHRLLLEPSLEQGFEPFTDAEADYAINNSGINWANHALATAIEYVEGNAGNSFEKWEIRSLFSDGDFTNAEIEYAVNNCGVDWSSIEDDSSNNEGFTADDEFADDEYSSDREEHDEGSSDDYVEESPEKEEEIYIPWYYCSNCDYEWGESLDSDGTHNGYAVPECQICGSRDFVSQQ